MSNITLRRFSARTLMAGIDRIPGNIGKVANDIRPYCTGQLLTGDSSEMVDRRGGEANLGCEDRAQAHYGERG
jgi:hypothetical protein